MNNITDIDLLKKLAQRWCDQNGFILGGYLGGGIGVYNWDSTKKE